MSSSSSLTSCGVDNDDNNPARERQIDELPEPILQEILSRVSAKYVLRCRSVCRMWKALTATLYFCELHHRNRNRNHSSDFTVLVEEMPRPVDEDGDYYREYDDGRDGEYLIYNLYKSEKKMYIFDAWRGGGGGRFIISPSPDYSYIDAYDEDDEEDDPSAMYISGSSCGLVVLHHKHLENLPFSTNFVIMNPIFPHNKVEIRVAEELKILAQIFGVFFHPVFKEFCALWGQTTPLLPNTPPHQDNVVKVYKLLFFNSSPSRSRWRNINNQSTDHILKKHLQPRIEGHNAGTVGVTSPVVLDDVLYWMVDEQTTTRLIWPKPESCCEEAILGFDTKTEEFQLLPHPPPLHQNKYYAHHHLESMHLLENTNNPRHLSLCQFSNIDAQWLFSIWIFKKDEEINTSINKNGSWIKTHTVKHNDHDIIGSYHYHDHDHDHFPPIIPRGFRPIGLVDEELLLVQVCFLGYLLLLNLKLGTCHRFESKRGSDNNNTPIPIPVGGFGGTFMCAHTHTLLPITNSNPQILLEEE